MTIHRYNATTLKKIAKLSQKERKRHLDKWDLNAYKDIKNICCKACDSKKKIPKNTLKRLKSHKNTIRKLAASTPTAGKKILIEQKGSGVFTALAAAIIPPIIGAIAGR